jgi:hypothetical protein
VPPLLVEVGVIDLEIVPLGITKSAPFLGASRREEAWRRARS